MASPYLLAAWAAGTSGDPAMTREIEAWRQDLAARGPHILGGTLEVRRCHDGSCPRRQDCGQRCGTVSSTGEFIASIDALWAALIAGARSSSRPHIRPPRGTRLRCARSIAIDHAAARKTRPCRAHPRPLRLGQLSPAA